MLRSIEWPPALLHLPESAWTMTEAGPRTRIRVEPAGYTLDVVGLEVTNDEEDGVQTAVADPDREELLLEVYNPEAPWQTWHGFGADYALYATPSADQDSAVAVEFALSRAAFSGLMPEFEERDRKLVTLVVSGHCALHLEARRVTGPDQEFVTDPEHRDAVAALAGWAGPYPTVRLDDGDYVMFAYPHGE